MKIILKKEVKNLGNKGEVKEVTPGYARNFLLPKKLAMLATAGAIKNTEIRRKKETKRKEKVTKGLKEQKQELESKGIVIKAKASEEGHLFAGVSAGMISKELEKQKSLKIKPKDIKLPEKIKEVGEYVVFVGVGGEKVKLKIMVEGE